jgi:CubicO group peptidase (beta-lactamase class C family)
MAVFFESLRGFGFTGQGGHKVGYSDLAYVLLGYALEDLTGLSFDEVLKQTVTDPLGLKDTSTLPFDPKRAILPIVAGEWYGADFEYMKQ